MDIVRKVGDQYCSQTSVSKCPNFGKGLSPILVFKPAASMSIPARTMVILEGSTNYGVDCPKIPPPSKDGESTSNLILFHSGERD